jgi:hypothetical protein
MQHRINDPEAECIIRLPRIVSDQTGAQPNQAQQPEQQRFGGRDRIGVGGFYEVPAIFGGTLNWYGIVVANEKGSKRCLLIEPLRKVP